MKKVIVFTLIIFSSKFCYCQTDTLQTQFLELVDKTQGDKSLAGTFMYKGYKVTIAENKDFKTTIGKFVEVIWAAPSQIPFKASYHNTLGYMTRNYFNLYRNIYKDYKVEKNKYCQGNMCIELRNDKKLPYILTHYIQDSEIREIK